MASSSGDEVKRGNVEQAAADTGESSDDATGSKSFNLPSSFCWNQPGSFLILGNGGKREAATDGTDPISSVPPLPIVSKERNRSPVPPQSSDFFDLTAPFRQKLMENCLTAWKACILNDPDMWESWKNVLGKCMDTVWVDVNYEVERRILNSLSGIGEENPDDVEGPIAIGFIPRYLLKIRAFTLHHYVAHNRSFFGKLSDNVFLIMLIITMVPIGGLRVLFFSIVLFMLRYPGPPDEFQLVNYILVFKGTQFVTSGIAGLASGAMRYFMCYTFFKNSFLECVEAYGPSSKVSSGHIFNYVGSVVLCWIAFAALPLSTKQAGIDKSAPSISSVKGGKKFKETWEKLRWLLYYDMACFALSVLVMAILSAINRAVCYATDRDVDEASSVHQFHANIFWCNVLYSLLSLPFLIMKWLPGALAVLTHTTITGYNSHGACVAFGFRKAAASSTQASPPPGPPAWTAGPAARTVTRVLRLAARGRQARGRGESSSGEFQVGDVFAGMFSGPVGLWTRNWTRLRKDGKDETSPDGSPRGDPPQSARRFRRQFLRNRRSSGQQCGSSASLGSVQTELGDSMVSISRQQEPLELRTLEGRELVLTGIRIPADAIKENSDGKTLFSIEVTREDGSPLQILRRYAEFRELFLRLGRLAHDINVPFPPKLLMACSGARLEIRRAGLETWLNAVVFHSLSKRDEVWSEYLRDFLDEGVQNFLDCQPNEALLAPTATDFYSSLQQGTGISTDSDLPVQEMFDEAGTEHMCDTASAGELVAASMSWQNSSDPWPQ